MASEAATGLKNIKDYADADDTLELSIPHKVKQALE